VNIRIMGILLAPTLLALIGGMVPLPAAAQTVLGPEYTLSKPKAVNSLQKEEKLCEFFLWTKLGGSAQRISFNYVGADGKIGGDTPRIENITISINPAKNIPTAQMIGTDENNRTTWLLEISQGAYDTNKLCLRGIAMAPAAGK
jgi:hypothetical protein